VRRLVVVLALTLAGAMAPVSSTAAAGSAPIGAHSMLQLTDPYAFMQAMFAEAAAMHGSAIRLDVAPAIVFAGNADQPPDFSGLDAVTALAQQYHLQVVGDLTTIPWWISNCQVPTDLTQMDLCGTDDLADYGAMIREIVARASPTIRYWEIWNEPDSGQFFTGTPTQYAFMLRTAHDAIKSVDPAAQVLLGGISSPASMPWLTQVFATPGADAVHAFDIANVHERAPLAGLARDLASWRRYLAAQGFIGPLWVTEHGYPSDPAFQYDPAYRSGPASQAAYLQASIPTLLDAGASEVFVTERDNLGGPFASEGLLGGTVADPAPSDSQIVEKPAYAAVQFLAGCYATSGRDCPESPPAVSPGALVLPVTRVGTTTTATLTVADRGAEPLAVSSVEFAGHEPARLAVTVNRCAGQILEPTAPCTLTLRYAPAVGAAVDAGVVIGSDQGNATVPVTVAAASTADLTPPPATQIVFRPTSGADGVGYPQQAVITVANQLPAAVALRGVGLAGPQARAFAITAQQCSLRRLAPRQRCAVTVGFMPGRAGAESAVLSVRGAGRSLRIALTATAFPRPAITRLIAPPGSRCRNGGAIVAVADQPSTLIWRISGYRPPAPGCARSAGTGPLGRSGRVRTAVRPGESGDDAGYPAQLRPWHGMRPGSMPAGRYRLTVTPIDHHGTGRSRSVWVALG
jgi:hypothetical protein